MKSVVTPADTCFWTLDSPFTQQVIGLYCSLDALPDEERLQNRLHRAIQTFPKMGQTLCGGRVLKWKDVENFNLTDHFLIHRNTKPDENCKSLAEKEFSAPLPRDKPPWKLCVFVDQKKQSEEYALLFAIHHAFADGLSGMALFYSLCDESPDDQSETSRRKSMAVLKRSPSWGTFQFKASVLQLLRDLFLSKTSGPLNGRNSATRVFRFCKFDEQQANLVRNRHNLSMNELFLTLLCRAVQKYTAQHDRISRDTSALLPVNLRSAENPRQLGNRLTAVRVPLPASTPESDKQLEKIHNSVHRLRTNGSFGAYAMMAKLTAMLPEFLRAKVLKSAARRIGFICTSAPGTKSARYIAGARLLSCFGLPALMHGQGTGFAFVRYDKEIAVALVSDPNIVDDPNQLISDIKKALSELSSLPETQGRKRAGLA